MNKELLQQALDALLEYDYAKTDKADKLGGAAIYALCIAIAQPEHPTKPVAWWIPKAEQFCLPDKDGSRPFANAWEPLYASPPIAQPVPPAAPKSKLLTEHSGCGHGTQVDQLTVRLNPGDKVVLVMGRYSAAVDVNQVAQPEQIEGDAKDAGLNADEIQEILSALDDHNGDDFEPECPGCTAYKKLAAIASQKGAA